MYSTTCCPKTVTQICANLQQQCQPEGNEFHCYKVTCKKYLFPVQVDIDDINELIKDKCSIDQSLCTSSSSKADASCGTYQSASCEVSSDMSCDRSCKKESESESCVSSTMSHDPCKYCDCHHDKEADKCKTGKKLYEYTETSSDAEKCSAKTKILPSKYHYSGTTTSKKSKRC